MACALIPDVIYSEDGRLIGHTETSACGGLSRVSIHVEPYRTMVLNAITDYALVCPYAEGTYRLERVVPEEGEAEPYLKILAQSALDENLWVTIGEAHRDGEGRYIFSLVRIRPNYGKSKRRHRCKKSGTEPGSFRF